ncbi:MAG: hypothetical protein LC730_05940 [Acidobacteria bacterium]|nr:hypothetical protein [Acidobacteriota bacterium]
MNRKRNTPKNAAAKSQIPSVVLGVIKSSTAIFVNSSRFPRIARLDYSDKEDSNRPRAQ